MIDRSYQDKKYKRVKAEFSRLKREGLPLAVISQEPTGTGKGYEAVQMMKSAQKMGKSSLFVVSGREIVKDFSKRLNKDGVPHETIMSGNQFFATGNTYVCSFHTLQKWAFGGNKIDRPDADLVIIDECRLSASSKFSGIVQHYVQNGSYILGLDATPKAKGIGLVYESIVTGESIPWHIQNGSLAPVRHFAPGDNDLALVKKLLDAERNSDGEIQEKEQEKAFNKKIVIGDVYSNWKAIAKKEDGSMCKSAIFNVNQEHAWEVYKYFKGRGEKVAYLDSETSSEDRDVIADGLRGGDIDAVMNISVLSYGIDIPELECVVANCSIRSTSRYLQIAGRMMRPTQGKTEGIFIDHGGVVSELGGVDQEWHWDLTDIDPSAVMQKEKKKRKDYKEITCFNCNFVFKGRRECPRCGHQMVSRGSQIPVYVMEAMLNEVTDTQKEHNKESKKDKLSFAGQCRHYALQKVEKRQWDMKRADSFLKGIYKKRYGVWPTKEMQNADPRKLTQIVQNYIKGYWIYCAQRYKKKR